MPFIDIHIKETLSAPISSPKIARAIRSEYWEHGEKHFDGMNPVKVHSLRTNSGEWNYSIEVRDGKPVRVVRFNGEIVEIMPFFR